jgi:PAS domain S-box-containing protein
MSSLDELVGAGLDVAVARREVARVSEQLSSTGTWAWDPNTDSVAWSHNMFRLLGLEPCELNPSLQVWVSQVHPDDRDRVERLISGARSGPKGPTTYRVRRPDGHVRHWHVVGMRPVEGRRGSVLLGCVRDITDSIRAEREHAAHAAVARALESCRSLEANAEALLGGIGTALAMDRGVFWARADDRAVPLAVWPADRGEELLANIGGTRLIPGQRLADRAWLSAEPVCAEVVEEAKWALVTDSREPKLQGALAIPVVRRQEVLAVLGFASRSPVEFTDQLRSTLVDLSRELGVFFSSRGVGTKPVPLTSREREILQLAADGCSGPNIARRLFLAPTTVKTHFEHIYAKYGVGDRAAAVATALRDGQIT